MLSVERSPPVINTVHKQSINPGLLLIILLRMILAPVCNASKIQHTPTDPTAHHRLEGVTIGKHTQQQFQHKCSQWSPL